MPPRPTPVLLELDDFSLGCGADRYVPGFYGICTNGDCRSGLFMPGPREEVDLTGIAANFRIIKAVRHADVVVLATTDGTDTRIYRLEAGAWAQKVAIVARVATDAISFNSVYGVAFGRVNPYQFSTNTGGGTWTFTASTKTTGNADSANYFVVQSNGLITPRCVYVTSPNEVYFTTDLSNGDATGSTATFIDDNDTSNNFVTSVTEDDTGRLLIGTRRSLWTLSADAASPERISKSYEDPPTDAGGQSDRNNFESYAQIGSKIYYIVAGYELLEYEHGRIVNEDMAPKHQGERIPRMHLPLNAVLAVGNTLILAMGTGSTLKSATYAVGGSARLANSFTTASELYYGQWQRGKWTWHGVQLLCTDLLRGMWFDEDTDFVYLASGAAELVNEQQRRFRFTKTNPLYHLISAIVNLATGTAQLEVLGIDLGNAYAPKQLRHIALRTMGLADATPSLEVEYKITHHYDTTAFESDFVTFTANVDALKGVDFPRRSVVYSMDLRFVGTGSAANNTYAIMLDAQVIFDGTETQRMTRAMR